MTTKNVSTLVYIAVAVVSVLGFSTVATAQDNTLGSTEDVVVLENATTTPAVSATPAQWFEIEKLSGEVNQGDFVVGPGRAEVTVRPGQTVTYKMTVANRISNNRRFQLTVEDISGSTDASRAVMFLGDERGPYTVKDYISFPENTFALGLGERASIPVTISIPPDAEPGGYYGGVLVSTIQDDGLDEDGASARSPIVARIGTLFFITVPGEVERGGMTTGLSLTNGSWWYEKGPIELNISFENTGSVHLNPYGEIRIKNLFGEEVGFTELEPWFVLPKSLRSRDISWDREMLFGRYTATAYINRGYDDIIDEVSVTFWVLPWKVVLGIFLVIFVILFSIRAFFRNFEFKRRA